MVGVTSFGAYVPRYRLTRDQMAKTWGQRHVGGERSVANHDEDSFTMAREAAANCLLGTNPHATGAVYFASVSAPYIEKQTSALLVTTCDLDRNVTTADFGGSVRASTAALKLAFQTAQAEPDKQVLVCAADMRSCQPGSELEQYSGDGAAALMIGERDPVAVLEATHSVSEEFLDTWRKQDDAFLRRGDVAFVQAFGYQRLVKECVRGLIDRAGVAVEGISRLILNSPDPRSPQAVTKSLEFTESQLQETLMTSVGDAGNASALLLLVHALEQAKPEDRLLLCNYGSGNADAFLFRVTEAVVDALQRRGTGYYLARGQQLGGYDKLLQFRGHLPVEGIRPFASATLAWKEVKQDLLLLGQKCGICSQITYPRRHVCPNCGNRDNFEDFRLGSRGRVFTFTEDHLFPSPDAPTLMAVVDLDGGGRFYAQMTDCDPARVRIGMEVELVLRRYHEGGGFVNYFWKFRPVD